MSKIVWDKTGERLFETGTDRGVLYTPNGVGEYTNGFPWNGITAVSESPSGAEATPIYADNIKYLELRSAEEFGATIESYTYPEQFNQFNGIATPTTGVYVGQQARKTFGLSYRTLVGNDLQGQDYGYKIHLVYGCTASPSERSYATVNDSPEAITLSFELTTTPVEIDGVLKPTAQIVIDSTKVDAGQLQALETILYGTPAVDPRLPMPAEVIALFSGSVTEVTSVAPTYDDVTDIVTIPSVTGVVYSVDDVDVPAGPYGPITDSVIVRARAQSGYVLSALSDDDWVITYV